MEVWGKERHYFEFRISDFGLRIDYFAIRILYCALENYKLKKGAPMDKRELEKRTKKFALEVIRFVADLPNNKITNVLGYQLLKCGTSIGANYRESNRAQSRKDFIHKIAVVEKEASETQYWLELFDALHMGDPEIRSWLLQESGELLAIFTSTGKTANCRQKAKQA